MVASLPKFVYQPLTPPPIHNYHDQKEEYEDTLSSLVKEEKGEVLCKVVDIKGKW